VRSARDAYINAVAMVESARQTIARGAAGGCSPVTETQLKTMEDVMTLLRDVHCRPVTLQRAREMLDDLQVELDAMEGLGPQVVAAWCSLNLGRLARLNVATEPACADPATRRAVDECTEAVGSLVLLYFELERDAEADTIPNRRDAICKVKRLQDVIDASPRGTIPHYHSQRRLLTCVCELLECGLNGLEPHEAVDRPRSSQATEVDLAEIPPGSFLCADVAADTVSLQWACPRNVFGRPMPILRYELRQRKERDDGDWTTCNADIAPACSSIAVRTVLPATKYRFKLRAEGPAGFGQWALLRGIRTDAAPETIDLTGEDDDAASAAVPSSAPMERPSRTRQARGKVADEGAAAAAPAQWVPDGSSKGKRPARRVKDTANKKSKYGHDQSQ
jgi:hypothetical protein